MPKTPPKKPQKVAQGMYQLRKNTRKGLLNSSDRKQEKSQSDVYLFNRQWNRLDQIAEEKSISRNEALRRVLAEYFQKNGGRE